MLKEQWEEPQNVQNSVLSYLLETRERLKAIAELAQQNEEEAKRYRKGIMTERLG